MREIPAPQKCQASDFLKCEIAHCSILGGKRGKRGKGAAKSGESAVLAAKEQNRCRVDGNATRRTCTADVANEHQRNRTGPRWKANLLSSMNDRRSSTERACLPSSPVRFARHAYML